MILICTVVTLSLTLSEVVYVSSLNISDLVLLSYSMANESDVMHRLTPGSFPKVYQH